MADLNELEGQGQGQVQPQGQQVTEQPQVTNTPPADEDPFDRELREAEEALRQSEAGQGQQTQTVQPANPAPEPQLTEPPQQQQAAPANNGKRVPVTALQSERERRQQLEQENAYLKGLLQGQQLAQQQTGQGGNQQTQQQEPELTPEQKLAAIRDKQAQLAAQFDDGQLSAAEWDRQRSTLDDEAWSVRQAQLVPQQQQQQAAAPVSDLALEQHLVQLEQDYPVLAKVTPEDLEPLQALAYRQAAAEGKPIQPGAMGTMHLRERVARLAQDMYGTAYGVPARTNTNQPPAGQPAGNGQPQQQQLSKGAQQRDAKLNMQQSMPPDVSNMGSAASGAGISETDLEARFASANEEEQIALLHAFPGLVNKLTGL